MTGQGRTEQGTGQGASAQQTTDRTSDRGQGRREDRTRQDRTGQGTGQRTGQDREHPNLYLILSPFYRIGCQFSFYHLFPLYLRQKRYTRPMAVRSINPSSLASDKHAWLGIGTCCFLLKTISSQRIIQSVCANYAEGAS